MANLLDYLHWRGDLRLSVDPFNEVDALILARLAYAPFDLLDLSKSSSDEDRSLKAVAEQLLAHPKLEKALLWEEDAKLLRLLAASPRFNQAHLCHPANHLDPETQVQFAAISIVLDNDQTYVAYRGTDATLVGWKEDFNMGFAFPVPAQSEAIAYLEQIARDYPGPLIAGGHSKGGNLAMAASAFCAAGTQERIAAVYNFDGPGFQEKVLAMDGYQRICERMRTFVPQSSIVGLLLEHDEQFTIVESTQKINLLQHDVYSWSVERTGLRYLEAVTKSSRFIDQVLKNWLADMSPEDRAAFVDALYETILQGPIDPGKRAEEGHIMRTLHILSSLKKMPPEQTKLVKEMLLLLVKSIGRAVTDLDALEKGLSKR